jgi:hypothetical protein
MYPWGGTELFNGYRLVGLYGSPGYPTLGVLGEQSLQAAVTKAHQLANTYQAYSAETVVPAFEIITTVASASPTNDNDYSQEIEQKTLVSWITKAYANDIYVVLDFQPGRDDFLTQVKQYESLLKEPHVGVALDPEWRLAPRQRHLQQIGQVSVTEINAVAAWLDRLTAKYQLPQKLLLIHQFRRSMIDGIARLNPTYDHLALCIQMDGQGTQAAKVDSYTSVASQALDGMHYGWKNFYDEDEPTRSPKDTYSLLPKPWFVSYQ